MLSTVLICSISTIISLTFWLLSFYYSGTILVGGSFLWHKISIGYTMEKCGICAYVTHEFAVFPEAKPREKTANEWVTRRIYHTFPWCN